MAKATSPILGLRRGSAVRAAYEAATPGQKQAMSKAHKKGLRGKQILAAVESGAPRRQREANRREGNRQLNFDRQLVALAGREGARARRDLRGSAPAGIDRREGNAGLRAARQNVQVADARAQRRSDRAAAAAAAAAPPAPAGRRRRANAATEAPAPAGRRRRSNAANAAAAAPAAPAGGRRRRNAAPAEPEAPAAGRRRRRGA